MRKFIFVITLLTFAISLQAQLDIDKITKSKKAKEILSKYFSEDPNTQLPENLKGEVKSLKVKYPFINEEGNQDWMLFSSFECDEQKRPVKIVVGNEGLAFILENKYFPTTDQIEQVSISTKIDGIQKNSTSIYIYTPENKIEYINYFVEDTLETSTLYKYSSDGELTEVWEKKNDNDDFSKKQTYEHENGKLICITDVSSMEEPDEENITSSRDTKLTYDSKGQLTTICREINNLYLTYDESGNVKQEIDLDYIGDTIKTVTYQYNDLNEEITRTEVEYTYSTEAIDEDDEKASEEPYKQTLYSKTTTEYENNFETLESKYIADENNILQLSDKIIYENEYDNKGNLIKIKRIDEDENGKITGGSIHEIEYDDKGNLIEQIKKDNNGEVLERYIVEIEYY